jgi:hypothetical protein
MIDVAIEALLAIAPMPPLMDAQDRHSTMAVQQSLRCSREYARSLWRLLRDLGLIDLVSNYRGPGFATDCRWKWIRVLG